jgi:hypothetical protein
MALGVIDWIALIFLGIGSLKLLSFGLFPGWRKSMFTKISKNWEVYKKWYFVLVFVLAIIFVYLTLITISVSEFIVAGYAFFMMLWLIMFSPGKVYKVAVEELNKQPETTWRIIASIWFVLSVVLMYYIVV